MHPNLGIAGQTAPEFRVDGFQTDAEAVTALIDATLAAVPSDPLHSHPASREDTTTKPTDEAQNADTEPADHERPRGDGTW
jgi:hypothetical protein